jgi:hypothetical protein
MPYSGTLMALGVAMNGLVASGQTYEVEMYRSSDGGATFTGTGLVALVDGSAGTSYARRYATAEDPTGIPFSADDLFAPYDRRSGALTGRQTRVFYLVRFD